MINLFQSIRNLFGLKVEVKESTSLEKLENLIKSENELQDSLTKAQVEFDGYSSELELKIKACDQLIQKGSTESSLNKEFLLNRLSKLNDEFIVKAQDITGKIKEFHDNRVALESEIIVKSVNLVSQLSVTEQNKIKDIIETWQNTGLVKGETVDHHAKAILLAIDDICKAEYIDSEGENKEAKLDLTHHYVNAIIRDKDNNILFLKRSDKDDLAPGTYCLPGGKIEAGESINVAIAREVKEETNLDSDSNSYYVIGKGKCADGKWAFYLNGYAIGEVALLDGENSNACWMCEEEWMNEDLMLDLKEHLMAMLLVETDIANIPTITKADLNELLEKGGSPASLGEIRTWRTGKFVKTGHGWIPAKESDKDKKEGESKKKTHNTQALVSHAENTSTDQLEKVIKDEGKETHLKDAAKRELERRAESKKDKETA